MFDSNGNLPPGIHQMSWQSFVETYGWNTRRQSLLAGLLSALQHLKSIGCQLVYIDGSFVTNKDRPGDYDACWERSGMDLSRLDPVLRDVLNGRQRQKAKYLGEFFPADVQADGAGTTFIDFFQLDRSDNVKGIVALNLRELP